MAKQDAETPERRAAQEPTAARDKLLADRYKRLPPAIPVAAMAATVGVVPQTPVGPEGAVSGGGDGD